MIPLTSVFYVKDTKNNLVPAKFLIGNNGQPVVNPNATLNTVNSYDNQYFNSNGMAILGANPNNYLVVPINYSINTAIQFANTVNETVNYNPWPAGYVQGDAMMIAAFRAGGSQDLQRTYQNSGGVIVTEPKKTSADVPGRSFFQSWSYCGVDRIWSD